MNNETKVIIIGDMPTSVELAAATKILASHMGITLVRCQEIFEQASDQLRDISEINLKSIKDFSLAANDLKVSMKIQENSQPKSKYINNPRHNFKNRGIPQKRNNRNYYKK